MTSGDHEVHLPYATVDMGEVAGPFQVTAADRRSVTVRMACPRCAGTTSTTYPLGLAGSKGLFGRGVKDLERQATAQPVFCECGVQHPDRPQDTCFEGCGAQWTLPEPAGSTT